jgi:hypothetical protein
MKVQWASQDYVNVYGGEIERLLDFLEHPEALVTDRSMLQDFAPIDMSGALPGHEVRRRMKEGETREEIFKDSPPLHSQEDIDDLLTPVREHFGIQFPDDAYIWQIAKAIHDKENG